MRLNSEAQFKPIIKKGHFRLLRPPRNSSRIVLSRLWEAEGYLSSFDGYGLFVALKGSKTYHTTSERYELRPERYLLLNYDRACTVKVDSEEETVSVNMRINREYVDQWLLQATRSEAKLLSDPFFVPRFEQDFQEGLFSLHGDVLGKELRSLVAYLEQKNGGVPVDDQEIYLNIAEAIVRSQLDVQKRMESLAPKTLSVRQELFARLNEARMMLADDPLADYNMSVLCEKVGMSEAHFIRSFKQAFHITPHQFQLKCRMERAAEKLRQKHHTVSEVARAVGYADLASFSRAFKQVFNVSPAQYKS